MIVLDYQLSPSWNAKTSETDLASVDEMALRYQLLLGDVVLKANAHDFSANWGWIPVIDFAAALKHIVVELREDEVRETTFDFTESDATLRFKRAGNALLISSSYTLGEAQVPFKDFATAVDAFACRVGRELREQYPALRKNAALARFLPETEDSIAKS
jgi:hypothetical protein